MYVRVCVPRVTVCTMLRAYDTLKPVRTRVNGATRFHRRRIYIHSPRTSRAKL